MKVALITAMLAAAPIYAAPRHSHVRIVSRSLAECVWDGTTVFLPDTGSTTLTSMDDVTVRGGYISSIDNGAASISFWRGNHLLLEKKIIDMSNPNGWIAQSDDRRWISLNSSNGGATGGWTVSIFHLEANGAVKDLSESVVSVIHDFASRHDCKTRGDNYESFQWRKPGELLLTASVYPTGDCGKEMGYTEGYVLEPTSGKILEHYSEPELLRLPAACIWNWDTRR
jgi:hypothetical protein